MPTALTLYATKTRTGTAAKLTTSSSTAATATHLARTGLAGSPSTDTWFEIAFGATSTTATHATPTPPAPAGKGAVWAVSTLYGATMSAGTWTVTVRVKAPVTVHMTHLRLRVYRRNGSTYTPVGYLSHTATSIGATFSVLTFSGSLTSAVFASGTRLYVDVVGNGYSTGTDIYLSVGSNYAKIVTPGYTPGSGTSVVGVPAHGAGFASPATHSNVSEIVTGTPAWGAGWAAPVQLTLRSGSITPTTPGFTFLARQRIGIATPSVTPPAVSPPVTLAPIPRVSETYPQPYIANGLPYSGATNVVRGIPTWVPSSTVRGTWAKYLQVIVAGQDVTFFRTIPTEVLTWSSQEPGGDASATIEFPSITGFDFIPQPQAIPTGEIVGIARTHTGNGYWQASALGLVADYGDAAYFGDATGLLNQPVCGIASHPSAMGYALVAQDGGVFCYGSVAFHGSMASTVLHDAPMVGIALTSTGNGYWLVDSGGYVYPFGDAATHGGVNGAATCVGICRSTGGAGFAIVDTTGKVHGFGDASTYAAATGFNVPAVAIARYPGSSSSTDGYEVVNGLGEAYTYGHSHYEGGVSFTLNQPVNAIDETTNGLGYWMSAGDGGVFTFGNAPFLGSVPGGGTTTYGSLSWFRLGAPVTINWIDATNDPHIIFEGVLSVIQDSAQVGTDVGLVVGCTGALFQLDWYIAKPIINLPYLGPSIVDETPVFGWDAGTAIALAINSTIQNPTAGSAIGSGPTPAPSGQSAIALNLCTPLTTGVVTTQRGAWDQLFSSYIQNILSQTQELGGAQYTVTLARYRGGAPRTPLLTLKEFSTQTWTVAYGAQGVATALKLDITTAANAIYGQGVTPTVFRRVGQTTVASAGSWSNTQYPTIYPGTAPAFPGTTFVAGSATTGFLPFSNWMRQCGYPLLSQNTYLNNAPLGGIYDAVLVEAFQLAAGIEVTGQVDATTWDTAFYAGFADASLSDVYYAPLWALPEVAPFARNPSGGVLGYNTSFNPRIPRVERYEQMGQEILKGQGILSATIEGERTQLPAWTGTITLTADPEEGSRFEILAGQNILLRYFHGQDWLFHISAVSVTFKPTAMTVTLTVSSQPLDLMTLSAIWARDAAAYGVSRQARPSLANLNVSVTTTTFDCDSGAGLIPSTSVAGGSWAVLRVPFAASGSVSEIDLTASPATPFSMAVFSGPVTAGQLAGVFGSSGPLVAAGTGENPWNAYAVTLDALGLLYSAGGPGSPCGYWPSDATGVPVLSGEQYDGATWPFVSAPGCAPWLWVAFWAQTTTSISGRIYPAPPV